ncbi:MAG: lytic murein transglycosylase B [Betaproteobacteria bacterium HGW-Betaproteobacteria-13]|jgi:membrane-bound lytic murein transglycosylase B|nr:MAG: lytic murein transglycosylase B [Betaproteobacteria bacterium HGW-Betaproteobacteria-19]PKO79113.1 MAG: lytic murein transglycosylase B [Betaproteobacteria bacterium HGW-Betaproteobacteria-13]
MIGITAHLPLSRLACTLALSLSFGLGNASADTSSYAEREDVQAFITDLSARHGFDAEQLSRTIGQAQKLPRVISLITPPTKRGVRSWERYRSRFIERIRIERGLDFWDEYAPILQAAEERYGVPAEIIVAIIGVETVYGRHTGNFETLSALTTLAFDYPPRADLFRRELEQLFLLAREQGREPTSYSGSYAGALGYPQFLPSSMRAYAVDFDANGMIDFEDNPLDAIGSVANYLHAHGWQPQAPVAVRARLSLDASPDPLVAAGIEPTLSADTLRDAGIMAADGEAVTAPVTLVDLETPGADVEYWLGYRNFYVITRYNRSSFYAMSVFELAQTIRTRRLARNLAASG